MPPTTGTDPRSLATAYFEAWQAKDAERLRALLADDATFRGPLGTADDGETCVAGLMGMAQVLTGIEIQAMVAESDSVITWFDLHTSLAPPCPTANWSRVEDGRIKEIRVAFDARELARAMGR